MSQSGISRCFFILIPIHLGFLLPRAMVGDCETLCTTSQGVYYESEMRAFGKYVEILL